MLMILLEKVKKDIIRFFIVDDAYYIHMYNDHEFEVIDWSLTSTSSLAESESGEGRDRHDDNVFDSDNTTVHDAETDQNTTASSD